MSPLKSAIPAILAFGIGGCSSFGSAWKDAAAAPPPAEFSLEGAWEGEWLSLATGQSGPLRCVIREEPESGLLRALYHARWGPLLTFEHKLPMVAQREGPLHYTLGGQADLGWPLGIYRYEGEVVGKRFSAKYWNELDHGSFEMTRAILEEPAEGEDDAPASASARPAALPPLARVSRSSGEVTGDVATTREERKDDE